MDNAPSGSSWTDGTLDRGPYAAAGALLFAIKHNVDRFVASAFFNRSWSPFNYVLIPGENVQIGSLGHQDLVFYGTFALVALPFILAGVVLTLRRLRAAGLPAWLVVLFFVPVVNLLFFLVLSIVPSRADAERGGPEARRPSLLDRLVPESAAGSAAMAILLTVPPFLGSAVLSAAVLGQYGWGLFMGLPFTLGLTSAVIYGYHKPRGFGGAMLVATLAVLLLGAGLFAFAIEGLICIAMAAPIGGALALLGAAVGHAIQLRGVPGREAGTLIALLTLAVPALIGAEHARPPEPALFAVETAVEVDAPPEAVWRNVVSFAELPPPEDWVLRTGIAYPLRAEIAGRGPGAVRRCVFTTGPFVEPIEVWDEPRLLKFAVIEQPRAMREWSIYPGIDPPHLDHYLVSEGGEFRLTALPGGRTRLAGTTWYRHKIWPAVYWRLFSDEILHRIHLRVLRHVKRLAEEGAHGR
jgi:uncharacterized membrane protein YhaH (DUF805 family)